MANWQKSWLCVIPARGGSKGLKDKNIRKICGRPLVTWAVEHALDSGIFDRIVVTTDSDRIAACVPEHSLVRVDKRPDDLASDNAHIMDVMQYVCRKQNRSYHYVHLLEPTSPLIDGIDIIKAANKLQHSGADFLISVCESDVPLGVAKPIGEDMSLRGWFPPELRHRNRQEVSKVYQLDGNIYMGRWHIFADKLDYWDTDIRAYIMPESKMAHIDDETDLKVAEWRMQELEHERKTGLIRGLFNRVCNGRAR